jgi:hypothetical protein
LRRCATYWPQIQTDVVRKVLSKARAGTIVTLIPGNHDEYLRRFCDLQLGNIMITREAIHRTADGRLLLVLHGDEFDGLSGYRVLVWLADVGYILMVRVNRWINWVRRLLGCRYWSLSAQAAGGRGRVRTHPQAGAALGRLDPVLQLWRLGRELHRGDRAPRRATRARLLDLRGPRFTRRGADRREGGCAMTAPSRRDRSRR